MGTGVYLHIPFCLSRCSYCDFAIGIYGSSIADRYINALCKEIKNADLSFLTSPLTPPRDISSRNRIDRTIDTIYFGGGTPSLLSASQIAQILDHLVTRLKFEKNLQAALQITLQVTMPVSLEVTLEINPGTLDTRKAREFRALGINRASFGAQTFSDQHLKRLGRAHNSADIMRTLNVLREAGFTNISFDLIAGLPEQTIDDWNANLDAALELRPEHLSLYLLEVHNGTPLAQQLRRGVWHRPDEELAAEMYRLMIARVTAAGYEHYEISNFCLPGFASRHNTKYWIGDAVLGFGCSAHSHDGQSRRWANVRDTLQYIELIESNQSAVAEVTELDERQRLSESLYLGLRMMEGIDLNDYRTRLNLDVASRYARELERFHAAGLIEIKYNRLKLTHSGALLSNEVFEAFV